MVRGGDKIIAFGGLDKKDHLNLSWFVSIKIQDFVLFHKNWESKEDFYKSTCLRSFTRTRFYGQTSRTSGCGHHRSEVLKKHKLVKELKEGIQNSETHSGMPHKLVKELKQWIQNNETHSGMPWSLLQCLCKIWHRHAHDMVSACMWSMVTWHSSHHAR